MKVSLVLLVSASLSAALVAPTRRHGGTSILSRRQQDDAYLSVDRRSLGGLVCGVIGSVGGALAAAAADLGGRVVSQAELFGPVGPRRRVVITGANSGVGLEGAKQLAARGDEVLCVCRTMAKAEKAALAVGNGAKPAVCDLADLNSVKSFAASVGDFDTLVLNAGVAFNAAEKEPRRTAQGFELTVGTNHLGHFALYELLEPKLRKPGKRLVVTASPVHDPTSGGGSVGSAATLGDYKGLLSSSFDMVDGGEYDADKAYKDSKLCNIQFTAEASRRLKEYGATANSFSPGLIPSPTGFFRNQNPVFARVFSTIATIAGVAETEAFGGACLAFTAVDASLDAVTNAWLDTEPPGKHQLLMHDPSPEARDVQKQKKLWEISHNLVASKL